MTFLHTGRAFLWSAALSIAAFVPAAQAKHYQVLHSFDGSDGSFPNGDLQIDGSGNLYGTTAEGGSFGHGTIFKLSATGDFSTLYSFSGESDGGEPLAGPAIDPDTGDLYGTTAEGGANGWGGVYKLTAAGALVVLHDFRPKADGDEPSAALTRDAKGNFYGTTLQDGERLNGTVFEVKADGKFKVLHAFTAGEGAEAIGRLVLQGNELYGVATIGGSGSGTIFELATDGTSFDTLYVPNTGVGFSGGVARDRQGNLYGGYASGADDYVYKLTPDGTLSPFYSFTGGADGRFAVGDMLLIGKQLYGATARGGANGDNGTLFKLDLEGNFALLHGFAGAPRDGTAPLGGLVEGKGGKLFGTTNRGGRHDMGIVFVVAAK